MRYAQTRILSSTALAAVSALALGACDRKGSEGTAPSQPAVGVPIGATLGTCTDVALCETECDAGSADRCRRLAATYAIGEGVDKDEARATVLYERACDMKDPSACIFAGRMFEYAHGVPKDEARAAHLYEKACDAGWPAGCYNLAIMYENGRGVPQDRAKAASLYDVACLPGAPQPCEKAKEMRGASASQQADGGAP